MTLILSKMKYWEYSSSNQKSAYHWTYTTISAIISVIHQKFLKLPKKCFTQAEIDQKMNLQVPSVFKQRYLDFLFKHQDAITIKKFDLGRAKDFTHKIYLKDDNPIYWKQFKIPEARQTFIEATLDKWLKFLVQFFPILCTKETGSWVEVCTGFHWIKQPLSYWKIQHKGNHQMHWHYWMSKLNNLFNPRPNIWILANETGGQPETPNSFHHSRKGSICMGHITNWSVRLPSKLSMVNGNSVTQHKKCAGVHQWSLGAYFYAWGKFNCFRKHFWMFTPKSSQGKFGEIFLVTRKCRTLVLCWQLNASNQGTTNFKQSRMPNPQLQLKWWDNLLDFVISFERTSKTLLA